MLHNETESSPNLKSANFEDSVHFGGLSYTLNYEQCTFTYINAIFNVK
jgi:hypothetical protein